VPDSKFSHYDKNYFLGRTKAVQRAGVLQVVMSSSRVSRQEFCQPDQNATRRMEHKNVHQNL